MPLAPRQFDRSAAELVGRQGLLQERSRRCNDDRPAAVGCIGHCGQGRDSVAYHARFPGRPLIEARRWLGESMHALRFVQPDRQLLADVVGSPHGCGQIKDGLLPVARQRRQQVWPRRADDVEARPCFARAQPVQQIPIALRLTQYVQQAGELKRHHILALVTSSNQSVYQSVERGTRRAAKSSAVARPIV